MAVKTWTTERVTSADINTYLTNSGMVYITQQTVGTGVSSVTISNCFSSTYDAYKITMIGGTSNTAQAIAFRLGASTTGYFAALQYITFTTGAAVIATDNNASAWSWTGEANATFCHMNVDVLNPFAAKYTTYSGGYNGQDIYGTIGGVHKVAASYTGFTLSVAGTMTGSIIRVYGYRQV